MLPLSSIVRRRALAPAALALAALADPTTAAQAAPYTVSFCGAADRSAPGTTPFFTPSGLFTIDRCQTGGGFGLQYTGHALDSSNPVGVRLIVPTNQPVRMTALDFSVELGGTTDGSASGSLLFFDETYAKTVDHVEEWPGGASPAIAPLTVHMPTHSLSARVLLQPTSLGHTTFVPLAGGADLLIRNLTITLDDPFPPTDATFDTTSPLLATSGARGTSELRGVAHDAESGVGHVEVYDGTTLLARSVDSVCPRIALNACPVDQPFDLGIDTTRLAEGAHRLTVKTFDASGQSTSTLTPPFVVDNLPDPTATPTPAPAPTATPAAPAPQLNGNPKGVPIITAGKTAKKAARPTSVRTSWHKPVTLSGRLLAADGSPMAGASLVVTQRTVLPAAPETTLATVTTDADGAYKYTLTATASGEVDVRYPSHVGAADYAASRSVKLAVASHVTLKRTGPIRHGKPVAFAGRVDAATIPSDGLRIAIQYHSTTGAWLNADVIATRADGTYTWRHTFTNAVQYRLRTKVLGATHLSNTPGTSAEVRFRIR